MKINSKNFLIIDCAKNYIKRKKRKDKISIFKWSNLKSIRNNSLRKNRISLNEHEKWFNKKLKSKKDIIKIVNLANNDIGLVRIEKKGSIII